MHLAYTITQNPETSTEQEEINEDIDPFAGMDIASDTDSSDDDDGDNDGDDDGPSHTGTTARDIQTCDISLDSTINSEDESTDSEGEYSSLEDGAIDAEEEEFEAGSGNERDKGPAEFNHGFSSAVLGFLPPRPTHKTGDRRNPPLYTAGCAWTAEDWSCSYDVTFMAFWTLYEQSPASWRDFWIQHAPEWNTPLGNNFDHLIILADTPVDAHCRTEWFSRYRDRFRDQLSCTDPGSFPRRGPHPASPSRILEVMFGRNTGPYFEQHLVCSDCGASSRAERQICFLTIGLGYDRRTPVSLHTVWTTFVQRSITGVSQQDATCSHCWGRNRVQALRMPDFPWIWFERDQHSPIVPSLTLTFNSPSQQLGYSLRAIIYAGGYHFSVRFREQSGRWWKHDGQVASGVPQPDDVRSEAELLMNDTRFAYILIYRRDDH